MSASALRDRADVQGSGHFLRDGLAVRDHHLVLLAVRVQELHLRRREGRDETPRQERFDKPQSSQYGRKARIQKCPELTIRQASNVIVLTSPAVRALATLSVLPMSSSVGMLPGR